MLFDRRELEELLRYELIQLEEEGYEVEEYKHGLEAIKGSSPKLLMAFYEELRRAPLRRRKGFAYSEPSELSEIKKERPKPLETLEVRFSRDVLLDKIRGAWYGRCIGNMIGKPVEGFSRSMIERYLRSVGEYPLKGYFPEPRELPEDLVREIADLFRKHAPSAEEDPRAFLKKFVEWRRDAFRENIRYVARDDDIDYTILNLHVLETYGYGFTTLDIAREWLEHLPYAMVYTAERAAYRNLVLGLKPPETAVYLNPYREWIGAQIRADIWGYVSPGEPGKAAELAYRDARLSHVKNGIYGEMFIAATIAASLAIDSVEEAIDIGLAQIPKNSRLYEALRSTIQWSKSDSDWTETWEKIMKHYGKYHWVHTINNAAVVVMALLHGGGDYTKSVSIAVMSGLDTDCNGATVGSIMGAVLGFKNLPRELVEPLNNRVRSAIMGYDNASITELAERTFRIWKKAR